MKSSITFSIAAGISILVAAVNLQFLEVRDAKEGDRGTPVRPIMLEKQLPSQLPGWIGRDEPLGSTEILSSTAEKILNFDDCIYRIYSRGGQIFGVYVAYWSPGRMPVQKVASHTPDRCWSANGWTCESMRSGDRVPWLGGFLKPAHWRQFATYSGGGESRQYVLYWHLVGGELYEYGGGFNQVPNPFQWWRETIHYALKGSANQYFIRLTSNRPFEEVLNDPGIQEMLATLARLGLAVEDAGSSAKHK